MKCTFLDSRSSRETISGPPAPPLMLQDRVFSGARLNVLMPGCDRESLALSKLLNVETLSRQPQSASTLFLGADS
jgi:hypothetical protein